MKNASENTTAKKELDDLTEMEKHTIEQLIAGSPIGEHHVSVFAQLLFRIILTAVGRNIAKALVDKTGLQYAVAREIVDLVMKRWGE